MAVSLSAASRHTFEFPIPVVLSQKKTLLKVCWYVLTVKNMHSGSMRQGEAELRTLWY